MGIDQREIEQPDENWIGCAVCLNQKSQRVKAEVVVNGLSVCADHVAIASNPNFDIQMLRTVTKDDAQREIRRRAV